jgi:hypothetical protein
MTGKFMAIPAGTLNTLIGDPSGILSIIYPDERQASQLQYLDVDKAWHGIHYLLTGEPWGVEPPLSAAVLGGTEFGENFGYGPTRYLRPDEVKIVSAALNGVSAGELAERYSPEKLESADIYPGVWRREGEEVLEHLLRYYDELVHFYRDAAHRGDAVLQYIM